MDAICCAARAGRVVAMLLAISAPSAFGADAPKCTNEVEAELRAKGVEQTRIDALCKSSTSDATSTTAAQPPAPPHPVLALAADPSQLQTTASGLRYRILASGTGEKPGPKSKVVANYTGVLADGTVFDSTTWRSMPAKFKLKDVIPGWREGLQLIAEGGRILLVIPPELAYGAAGTTGGPIGPNATLYFEVELLKVARW